MAIVRLFSSTLIPPPPTSTLFPYTTLFRSTAANQRRTAAGIRDHGGLSDRLVPGSQRLADRKSTRLNSSHTVISYAVFCLKKKKNVFRSSGLTVAEYASVGCNGLEDPDREV